MRCVNSPAFVFALSVLICCGCSRKSTPAAKAEHQHSHGPHDGELIEIGNEEYHAELFDDDKNGVVTIYILEKDAKQPVPIQAETITIAMDPIGKPSLFPLAARSQDKDPPNRASRFESNDKNLVLALQNPQVDRELRAEINGKAYSASFHYYEPEEHHK